MSIIAPVPRKPTTPNSTRPGVLALFLASELELRALLRLRPGRAPRIPRWRLVPVRPGIEICLTGIGKVNAAAAAASVLRPDYHAAAISIGIGGALPKGPNLCETIVATGCVWADEGVRTPGGFITCEELGFPVGPYRHGVVPVSRVLSKRMTLALRAKRGLIATVSTCSGDDALAADVAERTRAKAEAMEGAAVGHVAHALGIPFAEVRVISNTTGNRHAQEWRLKEALEVLGRAVVVLSEPGLGLTGEPRESRVPLSDRK